MPRAFSDFVEAPESSRESVTGTSQVALVRVGTVLLVLLGLRCGLKEKDESEAEPASWSIGEKSFSVISAGTTPCRALLCATGLRTPPGLGEANGDPRGDPSPLLNRPALFGESGVKTERVCMSAICAARCLKLWLD